MTVTNIDAAFDSEADSTGGSNETAVEISVSNEGGGSFETERMQLRFSLSTIAGATAVTDSVLQLNVVFENVEASEGVNVQLYNGTGDDDPDPDTAADKYARSVGSTTHATIDCSSTGSKTGDLGTTVDGVILGNVVSPGFISFGLNHWAMESGEWVSIEAIENTGTDPATLTVTWTAAASTRMLASLGVGT